MTFTAWAGVARAEDGGPLAVWSTGPDVPSTQSWIVRLSADRILACGAPLGSSCVSPGPSSSCLPGNNIPPVAAVVIDVRRGTSIPAAPPPLGVQPIPSVSLDGDVYFQLRDNPKDRCCGADRTALELYIGAEGRWERFPLPPGLSYHFGLIVVGHRLVALDIFESDTAGMVLGPDQVWRALPPNPLSAGKVPGGAHPLSGGQDVPCFWFPPDGAAAPGVGCGCGKWPVLGGVTGSGPVGACVPGRAGVWEPPEPDLAPAPEWRQERDDPWCLA